MITIKDIIKKLEHFSKIHKQINSFDFGDEIIITKDIVYPYMFVKLINNKSISSESNNTLDIYLLDLSIQDDSNSLNIISNMELIGNDIISYFLDDDNFYIDETNVYYEPIFNFSDDNCDGYKFTLNFINKKSLNKCILPIKPEPLICLSKVDIPDRPIDPYLYPIEISASGGTPPYYVDGQIGYEYNIDNHLSISNSHGSSGSIEKYENYFIVSTYNTYGNYPQINFYYDNLFKPDKKYKIVFNYEILEGELNGYSLLRFDGNWNATYESYLEMNNISGVCINDFETDSNFIARNYFKIQFHNNSSVYPLKIKISDLKIYYLDEIFQNTLPTKIYKSWGSYDFLVSDSNNKTCNTHIDLNIPTPKNKIEIVSKSSNYLSGNNARIGLRYKPGDIYINWGDGTIDKYTYTKSSYYYYYEHKYSEIKPYEIDIYGSGFDGFWNVYYDNFLYIKESFWKLLDDYSIFIYRNDYGIINFNLKKLSKKIKEGGEISLTYNNILEGDIADAKHLKTIYNLGYGAYNKNSNYYIPLLYGDIGTFLKGYSNSNGYYILNSYFYGNGPFTYNDRIDSQIVIAGYLYIRGGYYATVRNSMSADDICKLVIDISKYYKPGTHARLHFKNNSKPSDSSLYQEFLNAKDILVNAGWLIYYTS